MDITGIIKILLNLVIIGVIYAIILFSLKIMYSDVKEKPLSEKDNKKDKKNIKFSNSFGLEIIRSEHENNFKVGDIIPIIGEITIGRGKENYIVTKDPFVSSRHAFVYVTKGKCFLKEFKNKNGTKVNGYKVIDEEELIDKDLIKMGNLEIKVIASKGD